jgi:hypothetical protein
MKLNFCLAFLFVFFNLAQLSFGQITTAPGYIINNAGDTIKGRLEYVNTNLPGKRAFISDASGKLEFLKPEQVQSLYISPEIHFRTLPFKGKKVFMQVVSEGQLDLYEYKGNLFVQHKAADSLMLLTGGKKTVDQNGKKYAVYDFSYKSQLRKVLETNVFDARLNTLNFDKKQISQLALEINGQQAGSKKKAALRNVHQLEFKAGFSTYNVLLQNIPYSQDSLNSNETFFDYMGNNPLPAEKTSLRSTSLGLFYKKKIGKKYSYLKAGIVYNNAFKAQRTQTRNLYRGFTISQSGDFPSDTIGKAVDTYTYKLNSLDIPLSYYAELADGKVRPFLDLGLNTRFYKGASVTLKRDIYNETQFLRTETGKMDFPDFTVGPMIGFGCRYLLNGKNSLSAGANFDAFLSKTPSTNIQRSTSINLYVSYGF